MDEILGYLQQARDATIEKSNNPAQRSRELSLVLTKIDEAVMWYERDIELKLGAITPADR